MKRLVTAEQMRELDRAAAERHGMPAAVLMENAGAALAEAALELASADGRFLVLCGRGNNGGDGLVAARKLRAEGRAVWVEVVGGPERLLGEAKRNLLALESSELHPAAIAADWPVKAGDVVIDALFGTGLTRPPEGIWAEAIGRIAGWRRAGAKVVAADLPSGLHSDTGQPLDRCVAADLTVSFGLLKLGQLLEPGRSLCGELREVEIGLPPLAIQALPKQGPFLLDEEGAKANLPHRRRDSHKGTYGHVLVVAGSRGKTGAAAMTALAALRAGAGLVSVATRPDALGAVMAHAPELMGVDLPAEGPLGPADFTALLEACDKRSAVVVGPGIPRGPQTGQLLGALLEELTLPVVLDADALNALDDPPALLKRARCPVILTPHPGEMSRLCGRSIAQVQEDRMGTATALAASSRVLVVLKGASTLIAQEDGTVMVNPTGTPGMATGGTGDVLSGVIGGLLAQGLSPAAAAATGVYAHGLAGELGAARTGELGLIATDLLEGLCQVWVRWGR